MAGGATQPRPARHGWSRNSPTGCCSPAAWQRWPDRAGHRRCGPTLSGLVNDLLLVAMARASRWPSRPSGETARASSARVFDIRVYDAESGEDKSVTAMSGGERVWINECLVRAVALYLAQNTRPALRHPVLRRDRQGTAGPGAQAHVHGDEAAGAGAGGYAREFFVSQTPELTAMADALIDRDAMSVEGCLRSTVQRIAARDVLRSVLIRTSFGRTKILASELVAPKQLKVMLSGNQI